MFAHVVSPIPRNITEVTDWTTFQIVGRRGVKRWYGFSFHETIIPAGAELNLWYKHHLETVYCVAGNGSILVKATGDSDDTLYAFDKHDQHTLRGGTEDMRLICAFNPPVTGSEVHDEDGAYVQDTSKD